MELDFLKDRIVILDGAMGTVLQKTIIPAKRMISVIPQLIPQYFTASASVLKKIFLNIKIAGVMGLHIKII